MQFMFEASEPYKLKEDGILEQVNVNVLETDSLCPRTNRRKIRVYLIRECGIHPAWVKKALRDLDLVQAPRRTLRELKDWMTRHAPEVAKEDYGHTAWAVKTHPESPYGVLCGFRRRRVQQLQDAENARQQKLEEERRQAVVAEQNRQYQNDLRKQIGDLHGAEVARSANEAGDAHMLSVLDGVIKEHENGCTTKDGSSPV